MNKPKLYVDFNEMLEPDMVLLSVDDTKTDAHGAIVVLTEGLQVDVYTDDVDESGGVDNLLATGVVERNVTAVAWAGHVKWCCRIDDAGIGHESSRKAKG